MKKTIICNIPMKDDVYLNKYESNDLSLPVVDKEVRFPINAFLEKNVTPEDEILLRPIGIESLCTTKEVHHG